MTQRIRVGVVGLGYFGSFHAKHYAAHPEAELVAIADPSEGRGAFVRSTYGDIHHTDHRDLIGLVDAVSIAAPTALHHRIAPDFIEAGIHVLIEKPLAETAAGARDLAERAARKGTILHVGHVERFSPAYRSLRQAVAAPILIECRRHTMWTGRVIDVDVVLDLMIHDIDLALDLAGSNVTAVAASGVEVMGHGLDSVIARLTFANDASAHLSASRVAAAPSRVIIVQEKARTFAADLGARTLSSFVGKGAVKESVEIPAGDSLGREIGEFLLAVGGRGGQGVGAAEAVAALEVAEAVRAAARGGP
ncbi:MAG: Gfo/Idh/MocA family protein [Bauldia sp.]